MFRNIRTLLTLLLSFLTFLSMAQDIEQWRTQYIDSALTNPNNNAITVQAYSGETVTQAELDTIYDRMTTKSTIDFDIVKLVRVMFLGNGQYDSQIIPELNLVPYWVNNYDTVRGYWSENHMIQWMSSDWLIHEYTGRPIDPTLEQRLNHYLDLKLEYGFYEFLSSTYFPYTLSGLLNLADFAEDETIRTKAEQVAKKLLSQVLIPCNDEGVFYPAAGRNYPEKYIRPYDHNSSAVMFLLTGQGKPPSNATHGSAFLATTSVDYSDVASSYVNEVDTVLSIGHTLQDGQIINSVLDSDVDEVMFQWSSGGYFHTDVVSRTVQLLNDSNMWNHVDFELLQPFADFPEENFPQMSAGLSGITESSVISGQDVAIFKNHGITLTSIQDFHKGKVGFQQWPVVATVGQTAVYPASGPVMADWLERSSNNANEHLPYVDQQSNVALIMYRPEELIPVVPFNDKNVALHWKDADFDETEEDGNWLLGRMDNDYVAIRRACIGTINGVRACETNVGQTWVMIVGNEQMYGSFEDFQLVVGNAIYSEEWIPDAETGDSTYYASINVDGISIDHAWGPEPISSVSERTRTEELEVFPNPVADRVHIRVPENLHRATLDVFSSDGRLMLSRSVQNTGLLPIDMQHLPEGMYLLRLSDGQQQHIARLIKR